MIAFEKVMKQEDLFSENTTIAEIDVSGKDEKEVLQLLTEKQQSWLSKSTISLHYKEIQEQFDLTAFQFLLDDTIEQTVSGQDNQCHVKLTDDTIEEIKAFVGLETKLDESKLSQALIAIPAKLSSGSHIVKLENYLLNPVNKAEVISETTISNPSQLQHLQQWVSEFPTVTIHPVERFSLLTFLDENGAIPYSQETLSTIATALYELSLATNFQIVERQISRELPTYAQLGLEAKVDPKKKMDFVILNPNEQTYTIEFNMINQSLQATLIGPSFMYQYEVKIAEKKAVKRKTIVQYDPILSRGQTRISKEGKDGSIVKVYRKIVDNYGILVDNQLVSEDYYPPVHRVEVRSLLEEELEQPQNQPNININEQFDEEYETDDGDQIITAN